MPNSTTKSQPSTSIKCGNMGSSSFVDLTPANTCRLDAQVQAVKNYHAEYPAAFFVGNAFSIEDNKQYKCGFFHLYYSVTGQLCGIKITPTGRITQKYCTPLEESRHNKVDEVLKNYGPYKG